MVRETQKCRKDDDLSERKVMGSNPRAGKDFTSKASIGEHYNQEAK